MAYERLDEALRQLKTYREREEATEKQKKEGEEARVQLNTVSQFCTLAHASDKWNVSSLQLRCPGSMSRLRPCLGGAHCRGSTGMTTPSAASTTSPASRHRSSRKRGTGSPQGVEFAPDSRLEGTGFELVWGFLCQVIVLVFCRFFVRSGGRPFFAPSLAIRFAERAEGVKGPKR
jgi:hypothetical protein